MTYSIKETFATLQGEGLWTGRRVVFLRFAGCNVWTGRPEDREKGLAGCARWCDTDFFKGDKMDEDSVLLALDAAWGHAPAGRATSDCRMVVISGGEPTLQLDDALVRALHREQWYVAVETNGSKDARALDHCDHVCVSPKAGMALERWKGGELKVVLPGGVLNAPSHHQWSNEALEAIETRGVWGALFVQPQDPTNEVTVGDTYLHRQGERMTDGAMRYAANLKRCVDFITAHPGWRLSLQTHKLSGLP